MQRPFDRALVMVCLLITFSTSPLACWNVYAQLAPPTGSQIQDIFPPADREMKQVITRAEKAIAERRYRDAATELGKLLEGEVFDESSAEDYFIGKVGEGGTQTSLKAEAQRMLGELPAEGLEEYQLQFGANGQDRLDEAVKSGDIQKLTDVTRMYFHTKAGYEATMLLGRHHLDEGRPLAAGLCFQRVASSPAARQYDPELSIMLATCWLLANRPERARTVLVELNNRNSKLPISAGGEQRKLFAKDEDPVKWLTKLIGKLPGHGAALSSDWLVFRGSATRNARTSGGLPLPTLRWRVPTVNDPTDEETVKMLGKQYLDTTAALPSLHPLAVNDVVLMRTPERLVAVNFQNGKRVWEFPWSTESAYEQTWQSNARFPQTANNGPPRHNELNQRIWDDAPHGQISSDGEAVFLLADLGYAQPSGNQFNIAMGGLRMQNPNFPTDTNKLVALNLAREGAFLWEVGGGQGKGDEPGLSSAFFLGAPLPLMGQLYVLAEINGEIKLVVMDPKTGAQQWSQQIAQLENSPILIDGPRRLAGASPSFADGVLVCPTSAGAVVAIDSSTRSLLWGFQYPKATRNPYNPGFGRVNILESRKLGSRWVDGTVTIADGHVILTPVESEEMYCLDLLTGKPLWPAAKKRGDMLYVACVHDGKVVMVGKNEIAALRLNDGEQDWSISLGNNVMPSGRGFYSESFYYLPTTQSKLLKVDVAKGEVVSEVETDFPLGNLICYKGEVISHGPDWLATFHQDAPLRSEVLKRLDKDANDIWALSRQAELLLLDSKKTEALNTLRRAYELDRQNEATKTLLVRTMLTALRDDFDANANVAAELEGLIDQPAQRAEFARLQAVGLLNKGDANAAFEAFVGLTGLGRLKFDPAATGQDQMEPVEPNLVVRHDRWVRARLAELFQKVSADERANMDMQIQSILDAALATGEMKSIRQFVDFFGFHPTADAARIALVEKLIASGELVDAEIHCAPLLRSPDQATSGAGAALTAELFVQGNRLALAAGQYRGLAAQWGDVICRHGKTGKQIFADAASDSRLAAALKPIPDWLYGEPEVVEAAGTIGGSLGSFQVTPMHIGQRTGRAAPGLQVLINQRAMTVIIRDGYGQILKSVQLQPNEERQFAINPALLSAKINGHVLVLSLGYTIIAIDLLREEQNPGESILWRQDLADVIPDQLTRNTGVPRNGSKLLENPFGAIRYQATDAFGRPVGATASISDRGFCFMRQRDLVCIDPITGQTLWTRGGFDPGSDLFGDDEMVFVAGPDSADAQVFDLIDGRSLGSRPVPRQAVRWTTYGRRVLSWSQQGATLKLLLEDVWTKEMIWQHEVTLGSRACLIEDDEVAVVQPDGLALILSMRHGTTIFETRVDVEPSLTNLYVMRSSRQYLLLTNSPAPATKDAQFNAAPSGFHSPLVYGKLYAFDLRTGKRQWDRPTMIDRFGFPLDQPVEVPLLTFLRHVMPQTQPRQMQSSVMLVDRRDGRELFAKQDIPALTHCYELEGMPADQLVTLRLPTKTIKVKFTDQPVQIKPAPAAPAAPTSDKQASVDDNIAPDPFGQEVVRRDALERQVDELKKAIEVKAVEQAKRR